MKTLIIAEKPSVAADIAKVLGRVKKQGDWYENDELVISSAVGHLVELFMPEDIDKKLKMWRLGSLPILPDTFQLKPIEKTKAKFGELKKLLARKDIGTVVNACDAGREGELIFTYIYEAAGCKKPVRRLWMQSMTADAIQKAWAAQRDGLEMKPLSDAARSRSEADWLIGINGTRAITSRLYGRVKGKVATVGRVQTPTLAIVVEREREIRAFKPRAYWRLLATFGLADGETYEGTYIRPGFKKGTDEDDRADRLWEEAEANRLLAEVTAGSGPKGALVTEEKKRTTQIAPRLYDLTTLQREANNRFGLPANRTLQIAQALYEKHKVLTYPRTDSRALPEDYVNVMQQLLPNLPGDLGKFGAQAVKAGWVRPFKRIFNNAEVSDHFAIVPTGTIPHGLDEMEAKLFDFVARRTVAAFFPAAEHDVTTRLSTVAGHPFKTEGKVLAVPGWLEVQGRDQTSKDVLPALTPEDVDAEGRPAADPSDVRLSAEATKPPAHFTEATLLSAMETAGKLVDDEELAQAMKEKGLGTPATRAATIEHLIREKYLERDRRDLLCTAKAEGLIDFLAALGVEALTSPALTGEWEFRLKQIEAKSLTRETFMQDIRAVASDLVERAKTYSEADGESRETKIISPTDGLPLVETVRAYRSQDGAMVIYKTIGNRMLAEEEIATLVTERQIGPLDGFRSKAGRPFSALLRLKEDHKIEFVFGDRAPNADGTTNDDGTPVDPAQFATIGKCPKCGGEVKETPNAFSCVNQMVPAETKCDFRFNRTLLGQTIPTAEAQKLLAGEKTSVLESFKSRRTNRNFSAHLFLKPEGGLGFEFPPRAPKAPKAPKAAKAPKKAKPEA